MQYFCSFKLKKHKKSVAMTENLMYNEIKNKQEGMVINNEL